MKIAISQPEHFPYLGYFEKMVACDLFVILDSVQFSGPRSFQNRNRFTNKFDQQQWFTVPVSKGSYFKRIDEVVTAPDYGWRKKLIKTMTLNFPGFNYEKVYESQKLVDINISSIELCRKMLNINTPMVRSSELPVSGDKATLVHNICNYFDATEYISGPGARSYLENVSFDNIAIKFIDPIVDNMDSIITYISESKKISKAKELLKRFSL